MTTKRAIRGTRTLALRITSELLYHLSHIGICRNRFSLNMIAENPAFVKGDARVFQ